QTGDMQRVAAFGAPARNPLFSPDGRWIACTVSDGPTTWTSGWRVQLIPSQGGAPKVLAREFVDNEFWPTVVGWSADGTRLYCVERQGTAAQLFAFPIEGEPIALSRAAGVIGGNACLNATRSMVGFTMQSLRQPTEAFVSKLDTFNPTQVTRFNDDLRKLPLA